MAERIHTFRARDGSGTSASHLKDGSNLPGGTDAWIHCDALDPTEMTKGAGVVGVGNAAAILAEVRRVGFYFVPNPDGES